MLRKGDQNEIDVMKRLVIQVHVDNLISGVSTRDEIEQLYRVVKEVFKGHLSI